MLRAVSERDAYANLALPALLPERGITGRDAAFATELAYGTCRTRGLLDAIIATAADRPPDASTRCCWTCCGSAPISCCAPASTPHAAVSTTVEQAGIEFDSARAGFVNGVLRTIASRDEQSWVAELAPDPPTRPGRARRVRARPSALDRAGVRRRARRATPASSDALLASDDDRPSVHLAARPGVLTADELAAAGRRHGRALFAVRGVPARRRSRPARAGARRRRRWFRTRAASWWPGR